MKRVLLLAVILMAAFAPGCRVLRRSSAQPPPPPPRPLQMPVVVTPAPEPLPDPPQLAAIEPDLPGLQPPEEQEFPGPPPRPRRVRQPQPPVEEASTPEPAPASPAPELAQILTPEQESSYNSAIDRNLERAQRTSRLLRNRKLNREQAVYLERINSFIQQAGEARRTDLVRAANLAERAAVLADDLLRTIR
ncbi:MAG: hypothetical protein ACM3ZB_15350 [bacterium]